eukprot:CAMPEP_0168753234 /NCGR_PEP_ID=MMETSP0724-20121128/18822_1 /TAXON_ID=265536 /ORGANISM="Amphiprora sp., Strain CCMP467" /LENGTH=250 /DNA_ID=CAMNT_0008801559 /DNA_START=324 /DNA_END=1076 /DNA_ORIENTATION=-
MSFQDFGGSSGSRTRSTPPSSGGRPSAPMKQSTLNQISESLLQYQRNVGILDKIVHSLMATSKNNTPSSADRQELELQYQAQCDVISQLGSKVHKLIHDQQLTATPQVKQTLVKLERDFERVQKQATALQVSVTRMREQQQQQGNNSNSDNGEGTTAYEQYQQQMQVQLQEDRLAEQIMREREDEIRNINRGMHQVNEIYKDLAHIVESQQEQVDAIETQMEDSRANAEAGLTQIEKANDNFGSSNCVIS